MILILTLSSVAKSLLEKISQAMGKPIANLSGEDVIVAFGESLD
jgi:hypothetical protein